MGAEGGSCTSVVGAEGEEVAMCFRHVYVRHVRMGERRPGNGVLEEEESSGEGRGGGQVSDTKIH